MAVSYSLLEKRRLDAIRDLDVEKALTILRSEGYDRTSGGEARRVVLISMHKMRYESSYFEEALRHQSGSWLRENGYGRMGGLPLLPEGMLP